jgi:hypothetical protein
VHSAAASVRTADNEDDPARAKSVQGWLNELDVAAMLAGKSYEKKLRFARGCVDRCKRDNRDIEVGV